RRAGRGQHKNGDQRRLKFPPRDRPVAHLHAPQACRKPAKFKTEETARPGPFARTLRGFFALHFARGSVAWAAMSASLLYESHSHTPLCHHAVGTPDEYATMAGLRGLKGIIFTC